MNNFEQLKANVIEWADNKDLIDINKAPTQSMKIIEEVGETYGAFLKKNQEELVDGIGDILVTIIIFSAQLGLDPVACLESAWNEIKDRKGKTVDGIFVKED